MANLNLSRDVDNKKLPNLIIIPYSKMQEWVVTVLLLTSTPLVYINNDLIIIGYKSSCHLFEEMPAKKGGEMCLRSNEIQDMVVINDPLGQTHSPVFCFARF